MFGELHQIHFCTPCPLHIAVPGLHWVSGMWVVFQNGGILCMLPLSEILSLHIGRGLLSLPCACVTAQHCVHLQLD